jgi:predicted DNA-binding transcriptional regulator AlpA
MSADPQTIEPLLLSVTDTAKALGISSRMLQKLNSSGQLPTPIRLGRRTLWAADELKNWCASGCVSRERWESMRAAR